MIPGAIYELNLEHKNSGGATVLGWKKITLIERRVSHSFTRTFQRGDPEKTAGFLGYHEELFRQMTGIKEDEKLLPHSIAITCNEYEWTLMADGEPLTIAEDELEEEIGRGYYSFCGMNNV